MAKKYKVEVADVDNAIEIAAALLKDLRDSDRQELEAYDEDAVTLIASSIENAEHCYIYRDMKDNILCIVGLAAIHSVPGNVGDKKDKLFQKRAAYLRCKASNQEMGARIWTAL